MYFSMMMRRPVLLIYFILLYVAAAAQEPDDSYKLYDMAMRAYKANNIDDACRKMEGAIIEHPAHADAYSQLGEWYFKLHKFDKAVVVFRKASQNCYKGETAFAKPLAKCLLYNYEPNEALPIIAANISASKSNGDWMKLRAQATTMSQLMSHPWPDSVFNLGVRVNTPDPELYPVLSADTQTLYYTRRMNGVDEDFFLTHPDSCGGWFTGRNMGSPPNSLDQESAQYISADGHYIFYTRCENRSIDGWTRGGCDLYMAYRADSSKAWSSPRSFGATINTPAYEGMPCLSADNRELYFVSDREGGSGGMDIWVSHFESGLWQQPRNMGPAINTDGNETAPFLHTDNRTLYFSSDGRPGLGGSDVFYSHRIDDSIWSAATNMGFPINTSADEASISVTGNGHKCYISSDRDSIAGNFDIYSMDLPQQLQPIPVCEIRGIVCDSLSKDKLNYASIYIFEAGTHTQLYHFMSNRGDASFMITLPVGGSYVYRVDRIGYNSASDSFTITSATAMERNIPMLPDGYVSPINDSVICTIHFPLNSAKLSDSDKAIIQRAIVPWLYEKSYVVYVNGYTDNTGNPLLNEQLSYSRANLVTDEISSMGIDPVSIQAKGWGEANPVAPNDNEEGMSKNRRVEVIIRR